MIMEVIFPLPPPTTPSSLSLSLSPLLSPSLSVSLLGQTGTVELQFSNFPCSAKYLLFQKSDGSYAIVVWNNVPNFDEDQFEDIFVNTVTVCTKVG
jgi:hypothetical protein